ncbi:MAG: serine hydrolase domain-containing protein [Planctomycetota bacterium]
MKTGNVLFAILLVLFSQMMTTGHPPHAKESDSGRWDAVAESLEQIRKKTGAPAVVAGIFDDSGREIRVFVAGFRDAKATDPIRRTDRFRIASVSKVFVGHAMLQLVDSGRVSLDDRLSEYLPDYPQSDQITLRMLGNHTSGVADLIWQNWFQRQIIDSPMKVWSTEELLEASCKTDFRGEPGGKHVYSNVNTILMAAVIEKVTGREYSDVLDETIFRRWSLSATSVRPGPLLGDGTPMLGDATLDVDKTLGGRRPADQKSPRGYRHGKPGRWLGYGDRFMDVTFAGSGWTGPAGSVVATLDDLAKAAKLVTTGCDFQPSTRKALHDWIVTESPKQQYGFHLAHRDGWMGHNGDVPGFNAALWHHPELKRTVIALVNLSNSAKGSMPAEEVARFLRSECQTECSTQN